MHFSAFPSHCLVRNERSRIDLHNKNTINNINLYPDQLRISTGLATFGVSCPFIVIQKRRVQLAQSVYKSHQSNVAHKRYTISALLIIIKLFVLNVEKCFKRKPRIVNKALKTSVYLKTSTRSIYRKSLERF